MGFLTAMCLLPLVSTSAKDVEEAIVSALNPRDHWSVLIMDNLKFLLDVLFGPPLTKKLDFMDYVIGAQFCENSTLVKDFGYLVNSVERSSKTGLLSADFAKVSRGSQISTRNFNALLRAIRYANDPPTYAHLQADFKTLFSLVRANVRRRNLFV
jgi:hypothetical protein